MTTYDYTDYTYCNLLPFDSNSFFYHASTAIPRGVAQLLKFLLW